jgi:hypothetical protein
MSSKMQSFLFLGACLYLAVMASACRSPRANLDFTPAMAQTFEIYIEKNADASNAKQLGEIEGYMMSTLPQHFARQGLSGRILLNPAEHKPGPNTKLLLVKLVNYTRIGYATTLGIHVTLKDGSTVLTSWQDSAQTSRPWSTLVNTLNLKIGTNLKKYYAPTAPLPAQVPVQPSRAPATTTVQ